MKLNKNTYTKKAVLAISILICISCGNDDDSGPDNSINTQEVLTISFPENSTNGQSIGSVNATSNLPIEFTVLEQPFVNAIDIDPSTGDLSVGDPSFFDFEQNPTIPAVIALSNGIETLLVDLQIVLTNQDDIAFVLTDSQQDYLDAQNGDWIEITSAEYEGLQQNLFEVQSAGFLEGVATINPSSNGVFTMANLDESTRNINIMPSLSLVFAFKYYAVNNPMNSDRHRVKQSSISNGTGFENIGNPLPSHETVNGVAYFVLKGSEDAITSDQGYLGFQKSSGGVMGIAVTPGVLLSALGEASEFNMESNGNLALYEGLSTPIKQWD